MKYSNNEPDLRVDIYDKLFALYHAKSGESTPTADLVFCRVLSLALQLVDREAREDERKKIENETC